MVNVRGVSTVSVPKLDMPEIPASDARPEPVSRRPVLFEAGEGYLDTPIYDRARLNAGAVIKGPAVIEQLDSTTVVLPGMTASVEKFGNIIIEIDTPGETAGQ